MARKRPRLNATVSYGTYSRLKAESERQDKPMSQIIDDLVAIVYPSPLTAVDLSNFADDARYLV